jgi:Domain of unknown function (DUF4326)
MALAETLNHHPVRLQRSSLAAPLNEGAVFVGQGTQWANPLKKPDIQTLRGEPDVEAAYQRGGWREAAKLLYREHLIDEELDPTQLRGRDLVCTCKLSDPCHADVLLELANHH